MASLTNWSVLGFHWPEPGLLRGDYGDKETRLHAARNAMPSKLKHIVGSPDKGKPNNVLVQNDRFKQRILETKLKRMALRAKLAKDMKGKVDRSSK